MATKKAYLFGLWPHSFTKSVFFVFVVFPRKKLVFRSNFFLGKSLFSTPKQLFPRENQKTSFESLAVKFPKDGFCVFWFSLAKLVFDWKSTVLHWSAR